MEYLINNKPVIVNEECGLYKAVDGGFSRDYAVMDPALLVNTINGMPREKAIEAITGLRTMAAEQAQWQNTPANFGFPILITTGPGPTPIDRVRGNIENTVRFADDVLKALNGE